MNPPDQFQLDLYSSPDKDDPFWIATIQQLNKFSQQTTQNFQALNQQAAAFTPPTYKTLTINTGAVVADSFPIDFPWPTVANDVHVAKVILGPGPVLLHWTLVNDNKTIRISGQSGMVANTKYIISVSVS